MHIIKVLYDGAVVNPVECFTKIDAPSQHSLGLSIVPCGVYKVKQFYQIVRNGEAL